jgi:hypothetical protein
LAWVTPFATGVTPGRDCTGCTGTALATIAASRADARTGTAAAMTAIATRARPIITAVPISVTAARAIGAIRRIAACGID